MNKHTPGPWQDHGESDEFNPGERIISSESQAGYAVAVTIPCGTPDVAPERNVANARLIASSPELLQALQAFIALDANFSKPIEHVRSIIADGGESSPLAYVVLLARKAIAKATGGAA